MLSSVGYDDTPKETLGSLRISTAETVFQKTREQKKNWRVGAWGGGKSKGPGPPIVCYSTMLHNGWDGRM